MTAVALYNMSAVKKSFRKIIFSRITHAQHTVLLTYRFRQFCVMKNSDIYVCNSVDTENQHIIKQLEIGVVQQLTTTSH